ncbi:hypothetical protein D1007_01156 [Hordeum vulgare]|nr:hypothetical protein D1007_01156 [Hordeum vulgare]
MDASLLPPVTVEVTHAPSPRTDLVASHVGPTVAQASVAPARKRHRNVVVQARNPAAPAAKASAPGANAIAKSRSATEKVTKIAGVKRKRIPATNKPPPSSSHSILERDAPEMPFNGVAPPASEVFDEMAGSGGSNNPTSEFANLLNSKNYTILEDQALIRAWSVVSLDACTGTSQTSKRYWQRIEYKYFRIMAKYPNRATRTFRSFQGHWENIKPMCSRWAACLEQVRNAPPSGTMESDYDKIAQHRYRDMEALEDKFFKLERCLELLQTCEKWKLIDKESLLLA